MLDTDICIYILTDRAPDKREHILARQPEAPLLLSAITVSDLGTPILYKLTLWRDIISCIVLIIIGSFL